MYILVRVCMDVYVIIKVSACIQMYVCVNVCVRARVCACVNICIYDTHTHLTWRNFGNNNVD